MRFFKKPHNKTGYVAISFVDGGICAAQINRSNPNRPLVEMLKLYPPARASLEAHLDNLAKELRANKCRCGTLLRANEYQLLSVEAPNVPPDELKTAIRWRLKDMLDYRVDDATIDVLDVPGDKNAPARSQSMFAISARNQIIEKRQALFSGAKISLGVIDIPDMAQRNISALLEPEGRGIAMLSFDTDGGLLTVTFSGELYLSRRIDVTLTQLMETDPEKQHAYFDRITLELQRSLDHFDRQYHFIAVSKLVLAPLTRTAGALQQYLAGNLYLPVESVNLGSVLDISRAPELLTAENQQRFFLTIGAALRHEETAL